MISKDVKIHAPLYINGDLVPCSRPKVTRTGRAYYPAKYKNFKAAAVLQLKNQYKAPPIKGALEVEVLVLSTRPKSKSKKKTEDVRIPRYKARGDLDNQLKTVLDSMEEAGIIENDSQIYKINVSSWYIKKGEKPRTEIKMLECSNVLWRI